MVLLRIPLNFCAIHLFSEKELYLVYNLLGKKEKSSIFDQDMYFAPW